MSNSCTAPEDQAKDYSKTLLLSGVLFLTAFVLLGLASLQTDNSVLQIIAGALAIPFAASAALAFWAWYVR